MHLEQSHREVRHGGCHKELLGDLVDLDTVTQPGVPVDEHLEIVRRYQAPGDYPFDGSFLVDDVGGEVPGVVAPR